MFSKILKAKKLYIISAFVVIGAVLIYQFLIKSNGEPVYEIYNVSYGDVSREIVESGMIKPAESISLEFKTQGRVAAVNVKSGDSIAAGQELIVLEQREPALQVLEAEAALDVTKARLDKILAGASVEDIRVFETAVLNADVALKNKERALSDILDDAQNDLKQARENAATSLKNGYTKADDAVRNKIDQFFSNPRGSNPQLVFSAHDSFLEADIESERFMIESILSSWKISLDSLMAPDKAEAAIFEGKQNLSRIKSFLDKASSAVNNLTGSAELSQTTIDAWKAAVSTGRTNVDAAWADLISQEQSINAVKITNQTNINTAYAAVDAAAASSKTAEDQLALKKASPQEADIALANAQVKQAQASLALYREKLDQTRLKSPINGIVSKVDIKVGENTKISQQVVSVNSRGGFQVEVDIYEEDIPFINIGNSVDIELIAFPGKTFNGRVVFIEPAEKMIAGVVYYEVKIGFEEEINGIKAGMTTDVVIKTAHKENVLIVPKKMIQKKNGIVSVEVLKNGIIKERIVEVGLEGSNDFFEILSGLEEGEDVVAIK